MVRSSRSGTSSGSVLVTAPGFDVNRDETGGRLRERGLTIEHTQARGNRSPEEVARLVGGSLAAIVSSDPFTEEVFAAAPDLRVVARLGVGTDSIDLGAATRCGVVVTTTPGLNDETCADHTLALLLAATRRIVENDASVRRGEWDRGGDLTPWDLHGKRVGIVGFGRIGRSVMARLRGFSTVIKIYDPAARLSLQLAAPSLEELLEWADVVTLHVPLTPETAGLIGAEEVAKMRPGAVLLNTSRGGVVDQDALVAALAEGRLRAAALDVFADEPPKSFALAELPNVVLSPHIGGLSTEAIRAMARRCVEQVIDLLDGREPTGVVNPAALERARTSQGGSGDA